MRGPKTRKGLSGKVRSWYAGRKAKKGTPAEMR
jgi:hypothetical protein